MITIVIRRLWTHDHKAFKCNGYMSTLAAETLATTRRQKRV
jgi:hypothetical protein